MQDANNVQQQIRRLNDSDLSTKINALKRLNFMFSQGVPVMSETLFASIEDCLQLTEQSQPKEDVSFEATSLVQTFLINATNKQQLHSLVKRRSLRLLVRNLAANKMQLRKLSHKCLLQFVKRYHDFDTLLSNYLKQGIDNSQSPPQLKQKCFNSFQSILIAESEYLQVTSHFSKRMLQQLIEHISPGSNAPEVQKAASQCLTTLCRKKNIHQLYSLLSKDYQRKLGDAKQTGGELADELSKLERKDKQKQVSVEAREGKSLSPDYSGPNYRRSRLPVQNPRVPNSLRKDTKSSEEIAAAEQMLRNVENYRNDPNLVEEIFNYIPALQNNFQDKRSQLFSISLKTIQLIFEIKICQNRFYLRLVPTVVERLNDTKFLVRNSVMKTIKLHIKTYTPIWVQYFLACLAKAVAATYKEDLITLLTYAYDVLAPFDFDPQEALAILGREAKDKRKLLKHRAIQCISLILHREPPLKAYLDEEVLLEIQEPVLRHLKSSSIQVDNGLQYTFKGGRLSTEVEVPQRRTPERRYQSIRRSDRLMTEEQTPANNNRTSRRGQRVRKIDLTSYRDQTDSSILEPDESRITEASNTNSNNNMIIATLNSSNVNVCSLNTLAAANQNSILSNNLANNFGLATRNGHSTLQMSLSNQPVVSMQDLSEPTNQLVVAVNLGDIVSPQRNLRSWSQGIEYITKDQLRPLQDPKKEADTLLSRLRDKSWKTQFFALNSARSLVEFHDDHIVSLPELLQQILKGVLNLRSSISKNSLMCLDEVITKLKRRVQGHLDAVLDRVMKKTIYTNEFLQEEVKKCLLSLANSFGEGRLPSCLLQYQDHKSTCVKLNVLFVVEQIIKNEKAYRKEAETLWTILTGMMQEPSSEIRQTAKRCILYIMKRYPDWRNLKFFKKIDIDRMLELERKAGMLCLKQSPEKDNTSNNKPVLEEKSNVPEDCRRGVERSSSSPKKYSASNTISEFQRLDQLEQGCRNFKDWKQRIGCLTQIFKIGCKFAREFCDYSNSNRYMTLLCQHIDDPHAKVSLNGLAILQEAVQKLRPLVQDNLGHLTLRLINGLASRKSQFSQRCEEVYFKLRDSVDQVRLVKELIKLCSNTLQKTKLTAIRQTEDILYRLSRNAVQGLVPQLQKSAQRALSDQKNMEIQEAVKAMLNSLAHLAPAKA